MAAINDATAPSSDYVLGYWDIKGLAAPIRMALHYGSISYRDEMYSLTQTEGGKWRSGWPLKAKELLASSESAFPNLPYLQLPAAPEQAGAKPRRYVMQSGAILRFAAQLSGLMGANNMEALLIDELLEQTMDLRNEMTRLVYGADFKERHESFARESLPYYFGAFEKYLSCRASEVADGAPLFYVGGAPSVADLAIMDALDTAAALAKPFVDVNTNYPLTTAHRRLVEALPQLQAYFQGPLSKLPPNNKVASWGAAPLA